MKTSLLLMLLLALPDGPGCKSNAPEESHSHPLTDAERRDFRESWGSGARLGPVSHPQSVAVASGPAPLAYITDQAGEVWITDNVGLKWGPVPVGARTVVRVAEETGIAVGSVRLAPGPLSEGRTYTINVGLPADQGWRNGTVGGPAGSGGADQKK
jgi:hypothetical protein